MVLRDSLRTIDLARAAGISVQQVRNYEALGLLPPASRSKSGYRLYTQRHLAALKTARGLVGGYGGNRLNILLTYVIHETSSLKTSRRWGVQTGKPSCHPDDHCLHSFLTSAIGRSRRELCRRTPRCSSSTTTTVCSREWRA